MNCLITLGVKLIISKEKKIEYGRVLRRVFKGVRSKDLGMINLIKKSRNNLTILINRLQPLMIPACIVGTQFDYCCRHIKPVGFF